MQAPPDNAPDVQDPRLPPAPSTSGVVRTKRKTTARMRTSPMSPALKARILACMSNGTSKAEEAPIDSAKQIKRVRRSRSTLTNNPSENSPPPGSQLPGDISDAISNTSHSDLNSAVPATDEMSVDEEDLPAATTAHSNLDSAPSATDEMLVSEVLPTTATTTISTTTSSAPCGTVTQLEAVPTLGTGTFALVQTSEPTLLSVDMDIRPRWLLKSIKDCLRYTPYYLCLNKVVDLFLAQEARLGYPIKVSNFWYGRFTH